MDLFTSRILIPTGQCTVWMVNIDEKMAMITYSKDLIQVLNHFFILILILPQNMINNIKKYLPFKQIGITYSVCVTGKTKQFVFGSLSNAHKVVRGRS